MSEVGADIKRKPVGTKTGLRIWGYKTKRELAGESLVDGLTGLLNRRGWDQKVTEYLSLQRRTKENVSFLVIDLDNFKRINDLEGHDAGDNLLRKMASVLKKNGRSTDIIARYGGDEFSICMPATSNEEAGNLKQRLMREASDISFSVGVGQDFKTADGEMYKMKKEKQNV